MAYAIVIRFTGVNESHYWAVNAKLGINRDGTGAWPEGVLAHSAGPTSDGWVVVERWVSKAAQQAFMAARLGPALGAVGVPAPVQVIETETVNDWPRS